MPREQLSCRVQTLGILAAVALVMLSHVSTAGPEEGQPEAIPAPALASLSAAGAPRSGRFRIFGSDFGETREGSQVLLGGMPTPVASWSDAEIHAYVAGDAPLGTSDVVVLTAGGASNALGLVVGPLEPGQGRVRWRFQTDSGYVLHRPAVGADGSIYVNDIGGFLYALDTDGGLRWIFDTGGKGAEGPVAIGADGTVYVAGNPLGPDLNIYALSPQGALLWTFTDTGQEVIAGPDIGPDGNLYVVADFVGLGAFSLSPAGELLWNVPDFSDFGASGAEIVFGAPDQLYVCLHGFFQAIRIDGNPQWEIGVGAQSKQPAVGPAGTVYVESFLGGEGTRLRAYNADGDEQWVAFEPGTNVISAPDVGPDGVIYLTRNLFQLHALDPDGSQRWMHTDPNLLGGGNYSGPMVSPDNTRLVLNGSRGNGGPGVVLAFDTADGSPLWEVELPFENGVNIMPYSRPRYSADGTTAYIGTTGPQDGDRYSYLYAIEAAESASLVIQMADDQISWSAMPGAIGYDVIRGDLGLLLVTGGDFSAAVSECVVSNQPSTSIVYPLEPVAPGDGWWFLVRDVTAAGAGSYESNGPGQVDARDDEIAAASPPACP